MRMPAAGDYAANLLAPSLIELTFVNRTRGRRDTEAPAGKKPRGRLSREC